MSNAITQKENEKDKRLNNLYEMRKKEYTEMSNTITQKDNKTTTKPKQNNNQLTDKEINILLFCVFVVVVVAIQLMNRGLI